MAVDNVTSEYIDLRRGLLNDDALPPFFVLEDLIFKNKYFKGSKIASLWKEYVLDPNHKPIDFYIHVPFCYSKCTYCTCPSDNFKISLVDKYVDDLISFLSSFEEVFKNTSFRNIYIGGGTPSILNDVNLDRLLGYIFSHYKFDGDGGKCSEMNPLSVTESKIAILKKYNFNRISFGVQSMDPEVLKLNNRGYQSEEMVERAILLAKNAGITHVNVDLIIGLYGDSKRIFLKGFKKLLSFKPYTISVYPLSPTKKYINQFFHGNADEFYTFYNRHIKACLDDISSLAKKAEYFVPDFSKLYLSYSLPTCWHYRDLKIDNLKNSYVTGFENNASVFGVGKYAESIIDGVIKYKRNDDYGDIKSCVFSGKIRSPRLEMVHYVTETLNKENFISRSQFKSKFNADILKEFKHEIGILQKLNVLSLDSDFIHFSVENKKDRFLYLSCFFTDEEVNIYFERRNKKNIPNYFNIKNNVISYIKDENYNSQFKKLLNIIRSLPVGKVFNGVVSELTINGVKIYNDEGVIIDISFDHNCLFTREYTKEGKSIFEEIVSSKEILIKNLRLVFFMKKNMENVAIIVKYIFSTE